MTMKLLIGVVVSKIHATSSFQLNHFCGEQKEVTSIATLYLTTALFSSTRCQRNVIELSTLPRPDKRYIKIDS